MTGADYLFALAAVAIAFVGFNAIIMVIRQTLGERHSRYAFMVAKNISEIGFLVVCSAMLPPLLNLLGVAPELLWRVASIAAAVPLTATSYTYPGRRRAATGATMPWALRAANTVAVLDVAVLVSNAAGWPFPSSAGVYAAAVSAILLIGFFRFEQAVGILIKSGDRPNE